MGKSITRNRSFQFAVLVALTTLARVDAGDTVERNWPQFRGSDATGVSNNSGLPDHWSETENIEWKAELPGRGWASPIVWGDNVFLTTVVNSGETEPLKKGLYFGGNRLEAPTTVHEWKVVCLDITSGKVRWEKTVHKGTPATSVHLKNSFASETPITDGTHVFACFGNLGIYCFDFDGNEVWQQAIEPQPTRFSWGTAASPVLHGDRLYYLYDNDRHSYLQALDKKTGKVIWSVDRDEKSNWATPFVWVHDKRTEIVTAGTGAIRSYDMDGKPLWSLKGMSSITIATPYVADGLLYVSSGYIMDPIKALYAIRPGAEGDITLPQDQLSSPSIQWSSRAIAPYNPSTLVHNKRLYVLYDRGLVSCFNSATGETLYQSMRLPRGVAFTTSPWCYDGKLFCMNEDGVCAVVREGDEFELLHTNELAADEICLSTPAIAGDRLLIRTDKRLYCVRNAAQK